MIEQKSNITLRDYFAGQVLSVLLEYYARQGNPDATLIAKQAYVIADAMLAESAK